MEPTPPPTPPADDRPGNASAETRPGAAESPAVVPWTVLPGIVFFLVGVFVVMAPLTQKVWFGFERLRAQRGTSAESLAAPAPVLRAAPAETFSAAVPVTRPVVFRLLAPAAQQVFVGGSFDDFDAAQYPLVKSDTGVWETTVVLPIGQYQYKFKVDGRWELDPANPQKTPAPREASVLDVTP